VASQQDQIDQIEDQMENSRVNAEQGLAHIQKANEKASTASACILS
jgi:t-SNARE complex subunit (syntaxin)